MKLFTKKTPVILDTNFLLLPGTGGIDVFQEIKELLDEPASLQVTQATEHELQNIIDGHGKGKDKFSAKLGFIMIKQQGLKVIKGSHGDGYADQAIVARVRPGTIVATLDKALQKEVLDAGGRIITVQNKRLALKGTNPRKER